jgi:hypothetical protein
MNVDSPGTNINQKTGPNQMAPARWPEIEWLRILVVLVHPRRAGFFFLGEKKTKIAGE